MSQPATASGGSARQALVAGVGCYLLWGLMPALFIVMGRAGASPWEILGERALWSAPWAGLLVILAGQGDQVLRVFRSPRLLGALALSALMIGGGWSVYVWAVNNGKNIESSLGYYINPLLNIAVGALIFRERIDRIGIAAIALATVGVVLQTLALRRPPGTSLVPALTFSAHGTIRKRGAAAPPAGLL